MVVLTAGMAERGEIILQADEMYLILELIISKTMEGKNGEPGRGVIKWVGGQPF